MCLPSELRHPSGVRTHHLQGSLHTLPFRGMTVKGAWRNQMYGKMSSSSLGWTGESLSISCRQVIRKSQQVKEEEEKSGRVSHKIL